MSDLEKPVPPAGEEIHLPEGSYQPIVLTLGITVALVGLTVSWWLVLAGGIVTFAVLVAWIRDTVREIRALPVHDEPHH